MLGASSRRHEAPAWDPMLPKQPARDPSIPNPDCWNLFTRDQEHLFLIILNTENDQAAPCPRSPSGLSLQRDLRHTLLRK